MKKSAKTSQLQIRVSTQEKLTIVRFAQKANMGISQWILSKALPPQQQIFQKLLDQLAAEINPKFILAEIHDLLNQATADEYEIMIASRPYMHLSDYLENYIAAMVEYTAIKKGKQIPMWVRNIVPLRNPVFGSDLESLRLYLLTHSPPPFRKRNIYIDSTVGQRV